MIIPPPDAPEDVSSGVFAPADSDLVENPSATLTPPSPEDMARDNARGGCWAMNEYYDGCVLLGADDKPVMRNDGSRVGFFFRDAQRLSEELAAGSESGASPSGNDPDDRAAAWRSHRRALAPLDSGFNKDWDPQRPKSTLADMTKWTRLLAYHYVQSTEPEEAVRHAVSDIFGKPLNGPRMQLWVPGKYNVETIRTLAAAMHGEVGGPETGEAQGTNREKTESLPSRPLDPKEASAAPQASIADRAWEYTKNTAQLYADAYETTFVKPLKTGIDAIAKSPLGDPGFYASIQGLGPPGQIVGGFGAAAASGTRALSGIGARTKWVTVGRFMSQVELDAMRATGRLQESTRHRGVSGVTYPPNPLEYRAAPEGDVFVRFDVPESVVRHKKDGRTARIYGPSSTHGKYFGVKEMPEVRNVIVEEP